MRTSLACNVDLRHFGVWRAAVGVLALLSVASLGAWAFTGRGQWPPAALAGAAVAAIVVLVLAASLARVEPGTLRLESGRWTFAPARSLGAEPQDGQVEVALDLGSFLLLSFRPTSTAENSGACRWLPAQRRGHEHDWHALRCAAYSPRPADPEASGVRAPEAPE